MDGSEETFSERPQRTDINEVGVIDCVDAGSSAVRLAACKACVAARAVVKPTTGRSIEGTPAIALASILQCSVRKSVRPTNLEARRAGEAPDNLADRKIRRSS